MLILHPYLSQEQDRSKAGKSLNGDIMGEYEVKNSNGDYFVSWVEKPLLLFTGNIPQGDLCEWSGAVVTDLVPFG